MAHNLTFIRYISAIVILIIVFASIPSVVAKQSHHLPELIPKVQEHIRNTLQTAGDGNTMDWQLGQFLLIFILVFGLYIDYLTSEGWIPGLTFAMIYLFVSFCILSLG